MNQDTLRHEIYEATKFAATLEPYTRGVFLKALSIMEKIAARQETTEREINRMLEDDGK